MDRRIQDLIIIALLPGVVVALLAADTLPIAGIWKVLLVFVPAIGIAAVVCYYSLYPKEHHKKLGSDGDTNVDENKESRPV